MAGAWGGLMAAMLLLNLILATMISTVLAATPPPNDIPDGNVGCITSGQPYSGQKRHTTNGKLCQAWTSNTPHQHSYHTDSMFPDGSVAAASDYCRTPDGSSTPWCYTTDPDDSWEYCDIPPCPTTQPSTAAPVSDGPIGCITSGQPYTGQLKHTTNGKQCQAWTSNSPHQHSYHTDSMFSDGSVAAAGSNCRTPDGSSRPWCYTTDPNDSWQYCDVPACPTAAPTTIAPVSDGTIGCLASGQPYAGQLSHTTNGKQCQDWTSNSPHTHTYHTDSMFPDGSVAAAAAYCRTPDGASRPWCYTTDPNDSWEYCDVPPCPTTAPTTAAPVSDGPAGCIASGQPYTGQKRHTINGKQCQAWTSNYPHPHSYHTDSMFPDGSVANASNYCRTPDGSSTPWCYTVDPNDSWQYCNISNCPTSPPSTLSTSTTVAPVSGATSPPSTLPPSTTVTPVSDGPIGCITSGQPYKGQLRHTINGKQCQAWTSNSPHAHNYHTDSMFPDGSVANASNYCRSPDGAGTPWCYTIDPSDTWQYCNVSACPTSPPTTVAPVSDGPVGCITSGQPYSGQKRHTVNGKQCQAWTSNSPHTHSYHTDSMFPDGSVANASNYCRSPDGASTPWCYTIDPNDVWEYCNISTCPTSPTSPPTTIAPVSNGGGDCKIPGQPYKGQLRHTVNGKQCQAWTSNSPHLHNYHTDSMFPDGSVANASNYCRSPDGTGTPWCYTTDPNDVWEYCNVSDCPTLPPTTVAPVSDGPAGCITSGQPYKGQLRHTINGKQCQAWTSNSPHPHSYHTDSMFPDGSVANASNYCRNPDGAGTPWCYTIDPGDTWQYCNVSACPTSPPTTVAPVSDGGVGCKIPGQPYTGQLRHTINGKQCQAWTSNSPHQHSYHTDSMFPDGSVANASNYCRNPDGSSTTWCYTIDPNDVWEYCNVSDCPTSPPTTVAPVSDGPVGCITSGQPYKGQKRHTINGKQCQAWTSNSPHQHSYHTDSMFPDGSVANASNYCRTPDGSSTPWCYTIDPNDSWEYCNISEYPPGTLTSGGPITPVTGSPATLGPSGPSASASPGTFGPSASPGTLGPFSPASPGTVGPSGPSASASPGTVGPSGSSASASHATLGPSGPSSSPGTPGPSGPSASASPGTVGPSGPSASPGTPVPSGPSISQGSPGPSGSSSSNAQSQGTPVSGGSTSSASQQSGASGATSGTTTESGSGSDSSNGKIGGIIGGVLGGIIALTVLALCCGFRLLGARPIDRRVVVTSYLTQSPEVTYESPVTRFSYADVEYWSTPATRYVPHRSLKHGIYQYG